MTAHLRTGKGVTHGEDFTFLANVVKSPEYGPNLSLGRQLDADSREGVGRALNYLLMIRLVRFVIPRVALFGIFDLILSILFLLANWVIYSGLALIFNIVSGKQLLFLAVILNLLSGSFLLATIIGSLYYNAFTRLYYTYSAIWIGFFAYLYVASVVYGIAEQATGELFTAFGKLLIVLVVLAGVSGLARARTIVTKEISLMLPNVPEIWKSRKIVWVSDLHLGQLNGPELAKFVTERVNVLVPDIVFVGGDLFDGTEAPDLVALALPLSELKATCGVYFITGNHEDFGDNSTFLAAVKKIGMRILNDELVEIDGLQIIGVDYHNSKRRKHFKQILEKLSLQKEKPSILLKHEPRDLDVAHEQGISLQLSGHTHRGQIWPFGFISQLVYKGYGYGLKSFRTMRVYTSSGTGTWGPPMRVGSDNEIVLITIR